MISILEIHQVSTTLDVLSINSEVFFLKNYLIFLISFRVSVRVLFKLFFQIILVKPVKRLVFGKENLFSN